jgi:lysophospholipase L1-like esterase
MRSRLGSIFGAAVVLAGLAAQAALPATLPAAEVPPGLRPGDTVVFYGDSITHHNDYVAFLHLFYATRYPEAGIRFRNAGVGGNRTSSALPRFGQDVADRSPTVVAVLFGMNDGNQRDFDPDTLATFQQGLRKILARIDAETQARVLLLGPTFFDRAEKLRHRVADEPVAEDYNGVLVRFGAAVAEIARERGCPFVDLNAPLAEATRRLRSLDPAATLSRDGVHPTTAGHFVIAAAILQGLGVADTVSDLHVDAAAGVRAARRCAVDGFARGPDGIAFDLREEALPVPPTPEVAAIRATLGFDAALNRQRLRVGGLPAGDHELSIDGTPVGVHTATEFAAGIDLATNSLTPQHRQAAAVVPLWNEWRALVKQERDFRCLEKTRGYRRPDGTYPSDVRGTFVIDEHNEVQPVTPEEWQRRFDELAAAAPDVARRLPEVEDEIRVAARPRPHRYRIAPSHHHPDQRRPHEPRPEAIP